MQNSRRWRCPMRGAAARIGVADALADEVRTADDLPKTCHADGDALNCLLRALASILRKEFSEAKIIILTAYASYVQGAMKLGARAYLLRAELDKEVRQPSEWSTRGFKRFSTPSRLQPDPQSDRASQIAPGLRAIRKLACAKRTPLLIRPHFLEPVSGQLLRWATTPVGALVQSLQLEITFSEIHHHRGSGCAAIALRADTSNRFHIDSADNQQSRNRPGPPIGARGTAERIGHRVSSPCRNVLEITCCL